MNRESRIVKTQDPNNNSWQWVVSLWENNNHVKDIQLPGKSKYYAQDVADNWEQGILRREHFENQ